MGAEAGGGHLCVVGQILLHSVLWRTVPGVSCWGPGLEEQLPLLGALSDPRFIPTPLFGNTGAPPVRYSQNNSLEYTGKIKEQAQSQPGFLCEVRGKGLPVLASCCSRLD